MISDMVSKLGDEDIQVLAEMAKQMAPKAGPEAWCKRCSRRHRRRECNLELVERTVTHENRRGRRAGRPLRKVVRWAHGVERPKARPKTKARKS